MDSPQQANADWFEESKTRRGGGDTRVFGILDGDGDGDARGKPTTTSTSRVQEFDQELDLFQRTMDTLDYFVVLDRLIGECVTVPAKTIIRDAMTVADDDVGPDTSTEVGGSKRQPSRKKTTTGAGSGILSMGLTANDVDGVHRRYQAVEEMSHILAGNVEIDAAVVPQERHPKTNQLPKKKKKPRKVRLGGPPISTSSFDIQPLLEKVDGGGVLDGPEILEVSELLDACVAVGDWCEELERVQRENNRQAKDNDQQQHQQQQQIKFVQLPKFGQSIYIDPSLLSLLSTAFDDDGQLSSTTFPTIGSLRSSVRSLKRSILSTLDTLLTTPSLKRRLSLESGGALYSEVEGRIVIPLASDSSTTGMGIVHDVSRSGKTSYVEPTEIVGPTNEMRAIEMELRKEERRVWRMMTTKILEGREEIETSIGAVAQLDLVGARIRLGEIIGGLSREGEDEGVMSLTCAKHPVLLLRGLDDVVGSDIEIGVGDNQGLVLTGPNSGGKTVILKLMGLCALMARDGIPIPAQQQPGYSDNDNTGTATSARIDFFHPILADIGDIQSVNGDLSTFSGHMLVCREVLAQVALGGGATTITADDDDTTITNNNNNNNALVLMDEVGSGTDPAQGVAIAQSLLEALVDSGARVAITTHYMQLKQLASVDTRFAVGGMAFVGGRPTYRLEKGVVGESFALSVAERLNLPRGVLDRAEELLDEDTRQMGDLIREMEDQKTLIDHQVAELTTKRLELDALERTMLKQQEKLEREQINARRNEARKFAKKLEEKEAILEEVLSRLKTDPSKRLVAKSWTEIKYVKRDALSEAENIPSVLRRKRVADAAKASEITELIPLSELVTVPDLQKGDALVICKKGALFGTETTILTVSTKKISVSARGMAMSMKFNELALPTATSAMTRGTTSNKDSNRNKISNVAAKALSEEEYAEVRQSQQQQPKDAPKSGPVMRMKSNTIDVLGCTFDEARRKCEDKFSGVMMNKNAVVYILHGHGEKGVLKQKLREWLKRDRIWVKNYKPADISDGGDAFTMVRVKKMQ